MEPTAMLNAKGRITVHIVSQHPLAIKYLLQQMETDLDIQMQTANDLMLSREVLGNSPVVLDSYGLGILPTEYIRTLNGRYHSARYIILDHSFEVTVVYQLLNLGVQGFITYDEVPDLLAMAIRSVHNGGAWIDAAILQSYMKLNRRTRDSPDVVDQGSLTRREGEILQLARQRLSNKEIASVLGIEVSTVKFHLSNIFSKMNVCGRSDLWRSFVNKIVQPSADSSGSSKISGAATRVF